MKSFDLEKALAGEPVMLRNGLKALICYRIPDKYVFNDGSSAAFPLQGIIFNKRGNLKQIAEVWKDNGSYGDGYLHKFDIIGMWENVIDPKDLPKPFEPKENEPYFYICGFNVYNSKHFRPYARFDSDNAKCGQCFRTEEDAKKWIEFVKSMKE